MTNDVVMHLKFHQGVISYRGVYCPLIAYMLMIFFSDPRHNLVIKGWNFMKIILSIYDHGVVMHLKF